MKTQTRRFLLITLLVGLALVVAACAPLPSSESAEVQELREQVTALQTQVAESQSTNESDASDTNATADEIHPRMVDLREQMDVLLQQAEPDAEAVAQVQAQMQELMGQMRTSIAAGTCCEGQEDMDHVMKMMGEMSGMMSEMQGMMGDDMNPEAMKQMMDMMGEMEGMMGEAMNHEGMDHEDMDHEGMDEMMEMMGDMSGMMGEMQGMMSEDMNPEAMNQMMGEMMGMMDEMSGMMGEMEGMNHEGMDQMMKMMGEMQGMMGDDMDPEAMKQMMDEMMGIMDEMSGMMGDDAQHAEGSASPTESSDMTRSAEAGAVNVEVTPLNLMEQAPATLDFEIALNTHSVELDADLAELAVLLVGDQEIKATIWQTETTGGHHVKGILSFPFTGFEGQPILAGAENLSLVIRDFAAVPERVFTWELADN